MRKKLLLCFCAATMTLLLGSTAYAWEAIDTNQDGTADSIRFCDGYCLDMNEPRFRVKVFMNDPATGRIVEVLYEKELDRLDEECRKKPGYVQQYVETFRKEAAERERNNEVTKQLEAKLDEIAGQCFKDSMTSVEKLQAAVEYFRGNYSYDDNVPEVYGDTLETRLEFLMKTRVLNKEQRNRIIQYFVFDNMEKYWAAEKTVTEPFKYYKDPLVGSGSKLFITCFIEGKLYSLDLETLELREGWTEEMKQCLLTTTFCEDRARAFSDNMKYDPETWKWIPEEFKKFFRDNGYNAPWLQ